MTVDVAHGMLFVPLGTPTPGEGQVLLCCSVPAGAAAPPGGANPDLQLKAINYLTQRRRQGGA